LCATAAAEEPASRSGADQPTPPASGSLSSDLNRSGGVIKPPIDIDPQIKADSAGYRREDADHPATGDARRQPYDQAEIVQPPMKPSSSSAAQAIAASIDWL
jgi:hypothetical protein